MPKRGKSKTPPEPKRDPIDGVDMAFDERRKRLIGLGLTAEEVDRHFAVTGQLDATAPTTVCTAHEPDDEKPEQCAKCGKPLDIPGRAQWSSEDAPQLTEEEKQAPYAAVLTPDQLAAVLGGDTEWPADGAVITPEDRAWAREKLAESEARQSEKRIETDDENAAQHKLGRDDAVADGPVYAPIDPLWSMRLSILAREEGCSNRDYVEKLVRRQWVARGKGKS